MGRNEETWPLTVTVTEVNEGPEIAGTQSLAFAENTATDRVLAIYTATDQEDPDLEIIRWSVTGRDGGDFSINGGGELSFRNPPDHERSRRLRPGQRVRGNGAGLRWAGVRRP